MEEKRKRSRKVIEEEDEEQKVEMFFALIRSTREARDRLRKISDVHHHDHHELKDEDQKVMKKAREDHHEKPPIWTPAFEWGDFTEGTTAGQSIKARRTMNLVNCTGSSLSQRSGTQDAKDEDEDGLDLKLSL